MTNILLRQLFKTNLAKGKNKRYMWDQKYASEDYLYGKNPNRFFSEFLAISSPGHLLLPGEGEGRNGVYAALQGWQVDAFDTSKVGRRKALNFASAKNVNLNYRTEGYLTFETNEKYDLIGLFYTHMPVDMRLEFHQKIPGWLKKGGIVIMEVFDKKQLKRNSGGPKSLDLLYREMDLLKDFNGLSVVKSETVTVNLNEGRGHEGEAKVIRLILKKEN